MNIDARILGDLVQIKVQDHGIGIPEKDLCRIFERFERAVPVNRYSGLGLGLFIANEIVMAHGGSIKVKSSVGQGSEFTVLLPLEPPLHRN